MQIWALGFCIRQDISKNIIARSFKLGQLIEDDELIKLTREILKKKNAVFLVMPIANLGIQNL